MVENIYTYKNYREFLKDEYQSRKLRRASYSIRAFARDLGISAGAVSSIFNGRFGLSGKTAKQIAEKLSLSDDQAAYLCDLAESEHSRNKYGRDQAKRRLKTYRGRPVHDLKQEQVHLLEKWYWPAILQMLTMNPKADVPLIAKSFRLTKREVEEGISQLVKLEVISHANGRFDVHPENFVARSKTPNNLIKNYHYQILDQTKESIARTPTEERKNFSSILTFDSRKIEEARQWIDEMHKKFLEKFSDSKQLDSVMAFSVHFTPLSEGESHV